MLEPADLVVVERVVHGEGVLLAAGLGGLHGEGHAGCEVVEALDRQLVGGLDHVIVGGVGKGQGQHALLLEVGLMDTCERAHDDGGAAQVAGLQSSVLAGRALAVILIAHDNPLDAGGLVGARHVGHGTVFARQQVLHLVHLVVLRVDGADEHVVGDVVQVAAVLEPGAGHGDVVSGALALGLDQDGGIINGVAQLHKGFEQLQAVGVGVHVHRNARAVGGGRLEGVHAGVKALLGQLVAEGALQLELRAVRGNQGVLLGVEAEVARDGKGGHKLGGGHKAVGGGVAVVPGSKVAVE
mmetsp:Transcript_23424/g.59122  ORF Transcript_23424/g.59122 Transcript_23424/m.59122 type:complete len:297 (-) Transcript_23424:284-1174(-)